VVIGFCRTRQTDDAHAVVGRDTVKAVDLANAVEMAHLLSQTLDMPQRPDATAIADYPVTRCFPISMMPT